MLNRSLALFIRQTAEPPPQGKICTLQYQEGKHIRCASSYDGYTVRDCPFTEKSIRYGPRGKAYIQKCPDFIPIR